MGIVNYILHAVMYSFVHFYIKNVLEYCVAFFFTLLNKCFLKYTGYIESNSVMYCEGC